MGEGEQLGHRGPGAEDAEPDRLPERLELLVAIGDLDQVDSADRLAAYAGLAPVANDSGKRTGRRRRPVR